MQAVVIYYGDPRRLTQAVVSIIKKFKYDGSVVKSAYWFCRGSGLGSQQAYQVAPDCL